MEDKYVEKVMTALRKEESNKRCADCNSLSPAYINLTIHSFVCSRCCGVLREFNFKIKGITTSKFTQEEVDQLRNVGGNGRVSEVWLGSHSVSALEYEMMNRDLSYLKQHLTEKYLRKKWYDAVAASKAATVSASTTSSGASASLTRSSSSGRASSGSGADASELFGTTAAPSSPSLTLAAPSAQGRARTRSRSGSGTNLTSGSSDHKAFLAETYARATGTDVKSVTSGMAGMGVKDESENDSDSDESSDDGKVYSLEMKEEKQRKKLKSKMTDFYKKYNTEKLKEVDIFVEWTLYHGLDAFNAKLIERYGVGIKMKKKASKLKERSRTLSQDKPGTLSPKVGIAKSANLSPSLGVKSSPLVQQKKNPEQTLDIFSMATTATATTTATPPPSTTTAPAHNIFGFTDQTANSTPPPPNPFAQQQDPFQALFAAPPQTAGVYQQQQQQQSYAPPLYPTSQPMYQTSQSYQFGTNPMQQYPAATTPAQQYQQAVPATSKNPFDDMQLMF